MTPEERKKEIKKTAEKIVDVVLTYVEGYDCNIDDEKAQQDIEKYLDEHITFCTCLRWS